MTALPVDLSTDRLRLILISSADAADMLAGRRQDRWHTDYPRRDDIDAASMVAKAGESLDSWGPRHIVLGPVAIGSIGCFGAPEDDEVEVGYGVVADVRRRGIATEALRALLLETDRLGVRVRASVSADNTASIRVLAKAGFTELRSGNDEGELVMARPLPT